MATYESRTYIGGKLFASGKVTSDDRMKPRMSTESVLQITSSQHGADARRCKTRESIAEDARRSEMLLRGEVAADDEDE